MELALLQNYDATSDGGIFVFRNRKIVIQIFVVNTNRICNYHFTIIISCCVEIQKLCINARV